MYYDTTKRLNKYHVKDTRYDAKYIAEGCIYFPVNKPLYEPSNGVVLERTCHCREVNGHHNHHDYHHDVCDTLHHGFCCENDSAYSISHEPATYNFTIEKGTTVDFDIIYKDGSKTPVNLTGYTAKLLATYNDKTFTINARICHDCIGKINLYMSAFESSRIFTLNKKYSASTDYTYSLSLISPSKNTYKILEGVITVATN